MYCERCKIVFKESRCPACGGKRVREPADGDPCFVVKKGVIWARMYEDVLRQNGIPFVSEGELGAGMAVKVGSQAERVSVYVPYARLAEAEKLRRELFGGEEE